VNLAGALNRYWTAKTPADERAAYFEILLCGGPDACPPSSAAWRLKLARALRVAAFWVEGRNAT
jgi:hypothetical protein